MAFLSCSDEESSIDVILFPKEYSSLANIEKGNIILINGKVERRKSFQIVANKIEKLR